jgi:phage terminase Nu1 subunit (DNA packaging protein)
VLPPDVEIKSGGYVAAGECRETLGLVLGISRSRVVNLAADGLLPRAGRGLFDLPACVQSYVKHKLSLAKAGDGTALSLVAERSRLTKIKADNAELEIRRLQVNWSGR